ncbi:MAG: hypothetical protein WC460_01045 [Patescibacteria group bacterium]
MEVYGIGENGVVEPFSEYRGKEKMRPQPQEDEIVTVVFYRAEETQIKGIVKQDSAKHDPARTKIVFIYGYGPEKAVNWEGYLPRDEEEWRCRVIQDTLPENPHRGVLKVRLIENLTAKQKTAEEKERDFYAPILRHIDNLETAHEIEKLAQQILSDELGLKETITLMESVAVPSVKTYWDASKKARNEKQEKLIDRLWRNFEGNWQSYVLAIAAWLEYLFSVGIKDGPEFQFLGKGYFRCGNCQKSMKISKELNREFNRQEEIMVVCEHCGSRHLAKKPE